MGGYLASCWLPYYLISLGPFVSTLLCFILGGIIGQPNQMKTFFSSYFYEICVDVVGYTRWGVPMLFFQYNKEFDIGATNMSLQDNFMFESAKNDYGMARLMLPNDPEGFWTGLLALLLMGTVLRVIAYIGLCVNN